LLKELDAFRMTLNTNPVFVMTKILFKEYFAKISYVVDKLVSEKINFSSSNSCLIQHVAKNIMSVKQKWIEIGKKVPEAIVMDDNNSPATINQDDVKDLDSILEQLIKLIEHFMERMKTNDLQKEQLELAHLIGSLWGQKKVKYYMNAYLQVAVSCLEQLHVRELYDILPIEEWCQELLKNGDKSFYEDISKAVQDVFDTKPSLHLEDKIRICALLALCAPKSPNDETLAPDEILYEKGKIHRGKMQSVLKGLEEVQKTAKVDGGLPDLPTSWSRNIKEKKRDGMQPVVVDIIDALLSYSEGQDSKFLPDFTIVTKPNSESRLGSNRSSITSSLSQMHRKKNSAITLDVNRRSIHKTKSFANDLFNFFNPSEKNSSNEGSQNLRPSISTPDIRESSENPFSFKKVETAPATMTKTNLVTPVLMIFIIGGVTPSEIRHVQEYHDKHYPNYSVLIGSTHMLTPPNFLKELSDIATVTPERNFIS